MQVCRSRAFSKELFCSVQKSYLAQQRFKFSVNKPPHRGWGAEGRGLLSEDTRNEGRHERSLWCDGRKNATKVRLWAEQPLISFRRPTLSVDRLPVSDYPVIVCIYATYGGKDLDLSWPFDGSLEKYSFSVLSLFNSSQEPLMCASLRILRSLLVTSAGHQCC